MIGNAANDYFALLSMTMRSSIDKWTKAHPSDLSTMLRYPLGWVDESGNPYTQQTGKRIRPFLLLLCADAVGGDWKRALPAAAAVEFLHNFSLVHDDIEDDSPTRHGRPTVWKMWGRATAINVGDGLFAISYAALSELAVAGVEPGVVQLVWQIYNRTNLELIRGQHLDMRFEHETNVSVDDYLLMIAGKSAALIASCAEIGSLIGSGDKERAAEFAEFGLNLGLAFQIRDDILGIWGDPTITGKSAATDILTRKKSLPVLYGLAQSKEFAELYQVEIMTPELVSKAVNILDQIGALDYAKGFEQAHYDKSMRALENAKPQGQAGLLLAGLTQQLLGRSA